ncbi:MAG: M1 family metallopeptidase, partial [bacterium]
MIKPKRLSIWTLLALALLAPVTGVCDDYFQQSVSYIIRVRLDAGNHTLIGGEQIRYTNNSPDTLRQFYLHLYPNAFRSKHTAFMRDYLERFNYSFIDIPEKYRSWIEIANVTINGAAVKPEIDDTIARIDLPDPLLPGASMEMSLEFEEKIPRYIARSGYRKDQYDIAQWYPKVVVYDADGFHPDQYRFPAEFYGEFGTFDVYIEVPDDYVVAATGELWDGDPGWSSGADAEKTGARDKPPEYKVVYFHAEDVHDFAWNASPRFIVQETESNDVDIQSVYQKGDKEWQDSTLVFGVRAVEWLDERVGPFPYPRLSIVKALMRGGMEYPMLVMNGKASESLVLHEVGHMYFYGALANNEAAEAWLDEGFTTFQTAWYLTDRYGKYGKTTDWSWYQRITPQYTLAEAERRQVIPLFREGYGERLVPESGTFENDYYAMVYIKASLMFAALRYVVGDDAFDTILETYYDRWKYKHVDEARFQAVCEEVSGMNLEWFFSQWVHTKKTCDYRLDKMQTAINATGDAYETKIVIKRIGEVTMPLSLELTFANGTTQTLQMPGRLRTIEKTFNFP